MKRVCFAVLVLFSATAFAGQDLYVENEVKASVVHINENGKKIYVGDYTLIPSSTSFSVDFNINKKLNKKTMRELLDLMITKELEKSIKRGK